MMKYRKILQTAGSGFALSLLLLSCGNPPQTPIRGTGKSQTGDDDQKPGSDKPVTENPGSVDGPDVPNPGLPDDPFTPLPEEPDTASPERGAKVPWTTYEAEDGQYQGELLAASRKVGEFAAESSGRRAVRLTKTGDFVSWKASKAGNSLVLRLSIPDAPSGGGLDSTISLYVGGQRVKALPVTSRYAWVYGDESHPGNTPGGIPRRMFDESRTLLAAFAAGTEIKVQKDAGDTAAFYVIDLIELEAAPAALTMPANFLSINDFGAKSDNKTDTFDALQNTLNEAKKQGKGVWIPAGNYWFNRRFTPTGLNQQIVVDSTEVRGAGMWHSNLNGPGITFACGGNACRYANFAISGDTTDRVDVNRADNGFNDGGGKDSSVDSVWIEHVKVGWWIGKHHTQSQQGLKTTNVTIKNSRFRNLFADGVNLSNGTSNSLVENNHFRYTGDDAIAMWSQLGEGPSPDPNGSSNIIRNNTVELPWRANCFAFYGSKDLQLINNTCSDTLTYPGFFAAGTFAPHHPFEGKNVVKGMTLIRAGGPFYSNQYHGALKLFSDSGIAVENFSFEDIDIIDPTYSGIHVEGRPDMKNISFKNVKISGSLEYGMRAVNVGGSIDMEGVVIERSAKEALKLEGGVMESFFNKKSGNAGW